MMPYENERMPSIVASEDGAASIRGGGYRPIQSCTTAFQESCGNLRLENDDQHPTPLSNTRLDNIIHRRFTHKAFDMPPNTPAFEDLPLRKGDPPYSAWGLWEDASLGALNHLTDEVVLRAAKEEIQTGIRIPLK